MNVELQAPIYFSELYKYAAQCFLMTRLSQDNAMTAKINCKLLNSLNRIKCCAINHFPSAENNLS